MVFQSLFLSSPAIFRVTLLSTSVKSYYPQYSSEVWVRVTCGPYRDEEACGPICAVEGAREELQPGVVSVHDRFAGPFRLHLRHPTVLCRKARRPVRLIKVQDSIEEGRYGASRNGLESWHGHGRRRSVSCKGNGNSITDQPGDYPSAHWTVDVSGKYKLTIECT